MAKGFDPDILVKTFLDVAQKSFETTMGKVVPTDAATHKAQNILEYQGRMSVTGMEKFNGPAYIAAVSFYLNEQDRDKHRAKGAMVLYLEASNTEKVLRGFGHPVSDEDEEEETLAACGKLCAMLATKFKENLSGASSLIMSTPISNKNSIYR